MVIRFNVQAVVELTPLLVFGFHKPIHDTVTHFTKYIMLSLQSITPSGIITTSLIYKAQLQAGRSFAIFTF